MMPVTHSNLRPALPAAWLVTLLVAVSMVGCGGGGSSGSSSNSEAPVAASSTLLISEDISASSTLNASDADGDVLSYSVVSNGAIGIANITNAATGDFTYTPNPDANGIDRFTFKASDGSSDSNTATVTVTIMPVNDAPVADPVSLATDEGVTGNAKLTSSDPDGDSLIYSIVSNGTKGSAVITDTATGEFTYSPNPGANGTDRFTFKVNDGLVESNVETVAVTINPKTNVRASQVDLKSVDLRSPQTVGIPIDFIAEAESSFEAEYQFRVKGPEDALPAIQRDWGPAAWRWGTTGLPGGTYEIQVWARNVGGTADFEAEQMISFELVELRFEDVTEAAGLGRRGMSWGGAWGDVNSDGLPDLWVNNHYKRPSLYVNDGNGRFVNQILDQISAGAELGGDTHGVAWADFDNDGDQDLIELNGGGQGGLIALRPSHFNDFYVNRDGILINEAVERGVSYEVARGRNPLWVDWDGDGRLDIFMSTLNSQGKNPPSAMYLQTENGTFNDISSSLGIQSRDGGNYAILTGIGKNATPVILVSNSNFPGQVYSADITVAEQVKINSPKFPAVVDTVAADFNGDLITDIYLARTKLFGGNQTYALKNSQQLDFGITAFSGNDVGVRFETPSNVRFVIHAPFVRVPGVHIGAAGLNLEEFGFIPCPDDKANCFSFNLSVGDSRVVGLPELSAFDYGVFIGYEPATESWILMSRNTSSQAGFGQVQGQAFSSSPIGEITPINFDPLPPIQPRDILLFGTADGGFIEAENSGLMVGTASRSAVAGDFDNDMDLDVYVSSSTRISNAPNILYINRGDGSFEMVADTAGAGGSSDGRSDVVLMADYDVDGFLDLFTVNGFGGSPFNDGPEQLYRNRGNQNNWLEVDLIGRISNRDGIGARVILTTPDGKVQLREQNGQMHAHGQNSRRLHFGLGRNTTTASIVVEWPSGIRQELNEITANQVIRINE